MSTSSGPFVHVLLFVCQQCGGPVSLALTSDEQNLEEIDDRPVTAHCACGRIDNLVGALAKKHLVEPWYSLDAKMQASEASRK